MKAPKNLQDIFLSEKEGRQYIKIITVTTIMGLFYLCAPAINIPVTILDLIIMALFAIYTMARILSIGPLSFYFIHPIRATHRVYVNMTKTVQKVSYKHTGYKKDYLQQHNRKNARMQLSILQDLIDFSIGELKISSAQLVQIATYIGEIYLFYIPFKKMIPINSLWFGQNYKHQKWLLADESIVDIALKTGTGIHPEIGTDFDWFEKALIEIFLSLTQNFIKKEEWMHAQQCLEVLINLAEELGSELDVDNILNAFENIGSLIIKTLNGEHDQNHEYLAFIESVGRLYIAPILGMNRFAEKYNLKNIADQFLSISHDEKSILSISFPAALTKDLKNISGLLLNEHKIENRLVTPNWYIQTLAVRLYCNNIVKYYNSLDKIEVAVNHLLMVLKEEESALATAMLASKLTELYFKKLYAIKNISQILDECQQYNKIEGLKWLSLEENSVRKTEKDLEYAINNVASTMKLLIRIPKEQLRDLPDFIGQAYSYGLEAVYQAAANNDVARLTSLFSVVMGGALRVEEDILDEIDGRIEQTKLLVSTETFEELFILSGFIKIYSALYNNSELWEPCKKAWGAYFTTCELPESKMLKYFIEASSYRDSQFVLKKSDSISARWQNRLIEKVKEKGLDKDTEEIKTAPIGWSHSVSRHKNPLARLVINRVINHPGMNIVDARDLFFGIYLAQRDAAKGLEFPDRSHIMKNLKYESEKEFQLGSNDAK